MAPSSLATAYRSVLAFLTLTPPSVQLPTLRTTRALGWSVLSLLRHLLYRGDIRRAFARRGLLCRGHGHGGNHRPGFRPAGRCRRVARQVLARAGFRGFPRRRGPQRPPGHPAPRQRASQIRLQSLHLQSLPLQSRRARWHDRENSGPGQAAGTLRHSESVSSGAAPGPTTSAR